ncbi:replicative DNA helicase [Clostridium beijerinckii]|uniref:replicative DNA helicase n=1 Tax=Clostridium beijerinckii TaxID=1520 RepID=UPI0009D0FA2B|nr:replicative DNA helicase [Clostridium beijerinckii]NRZ25145.1 replicative DNA helicase [Clostridium beijerinckii]NYB99847.1 replicative DNA helicase [Clostridium beijerinckii]NYB99859.1 replicative DNA helicase [Clostridium beijerinckii]OOM26490.1 replicative DNA helicase [Clostridium beijerinckii]SQB13384.1 replicative DNA helicase [Clostridium beijerinckii]
MEILDKMMPNNIDAEQAILGCIMNNTDKLLEVELMLLPDDFYIDKHKKIYEIVISLFNRGIGADLVTVLEEIRKKDLLDACGGVTYVSELSTAYFESINVSSYANIVKEKANRRKLIRASKAMLEGAYEEDIKSVIDRTENDLYKISSNQNTNDFVPIDKAVEKAFINLEKRFSNGGDLIGLSSGFSDLDKITCGLIKKDFVIIAARPSMGKTALALNIGQAASKDASVAIFSLEMSNDQLTDRLLSAKCLIEYLKIKTGQLNDKEFEDISIGANELMARKLVLDDTTTLLSDIKAKCRKLKIQKGLDVVIIDYLQLIRTTMKTSSREQEVSHISRELKSLAKELDITMIALSQLSRAPEQRADHRPILSDLRESGSIEQDADVIHFLYRDEYYNKETEDKNIAEVITAKNRNGQTTTTKLAWLGQFQRFGSLDVIRR